MNNNNYYADAINLHGELCVEIVELVSCSYGGFVISSSLCTFSWTASSGQDHRYHYIVLQMN